MRKQSIGGDIRCPVPDEQLVWVEFLNHMMHILYHNACLTSKIGIEKENWNHNDSSIFLEIS